MTRTTPVILAIGSSDSSGGAGIQADIKAAASVGCFTATVLIGITAQNTTGIMSRFTIPTEVIEAQFTAIQDDLSICAVKVGATWSKSVVASIVSMIDRLDVPCVVDPVLTAASGSNLGTVDEVRDLICSELLPRAHLLTPNLSEARAIAALRSADAPELAVWMVDHGAHAVVVTMGADLRGDYFHDGSRGHWMPRAVYPVSSDHGAGCTQSALVAGLLAQGHNLRDAVVHAGVLASEAVRSGLQDVGRGRHPVDSIGLGSLAWDSTVGE